MIRPPTLKISDAFHNVLVHTLTGMEEFFFPVGSFLPFSSHIQKKSQAQNIHGLKSIS